MAPDRVRVIAPDVGGGFGAKYVVYPEEIAVAAATRTCAVQSNGSKTGWSTSSVRSRIAISTGTSKLRRTTPENPGDPRPDDP